MTASDLSELLGLQPTGEIRWGLRRTRTMLQRLGSPHMSFRSIHVGGTNGKGSVAAMVARTLQISGHRVGLYTSPHLVDFSERIRIDERPFDPEMMAAVARRLRPMARELGATFFETATVLAFTCFAEADVDFAVAEVGLGGRLDATNVLLPEVAAITNVGWDHADYLGHSLSEIAREKAGICKPGIPVVLGRLDPEAARIIRAAADRAGAPVRQVGRDAAVRGIRVSPDHTELDYVGPTTTAAVRLRCPLLGAHQAWNAGVAALVLESLPDRWRPTPERIAEGIESTRWPGRLQIVERWGRTWVLDVAHNAIAVEALARALTTLGLPRPITIVVAILGDKPWAEMLPPLLAVADRSIFTEAPGAPPERRWVPGTAARTVSGYPVEVIDDFDGALDRAKETGETVVVTGSSYTVGAAMTALDLPVILPSSSRLG